MSLVCNLAGLMALGIIIQGRGGVAYLKAVATHDPQANPDAGYNFRTGLFNLSAVHADSRPIVFLGDSITYQGNWSELFKGDTPVLNRGIGGDTSLGVLRRIGQITALKPTAVFLLIGTNDHQLIGSSPARTSSVIREIVAAIRRDSPDTLVYVQALLPSRSPGFVRWSEQVNRLIAPIADNRQVFFVNFRNSFLEGGLMAPRLTSDGLHLSAAGYRLWRQSLEPLMNELLRKHGQMHPAQSSR